MLISNDSEADDIFSSPVLNNSILSYFGTHKGIILLWIKRRNKTPILQLDLDMWKTLLEASFSGQVKGFFNEKKCSVFSHERNVKTSRNNKRSRASKANQNSRTNCSPDLITLWDLCIFESVLLRLYSFGSKESRLYILNICTLK